MTNRARRCGQSAVCPPKGSGRYCVAQAAASGTNLGMVERAEVRRWSESAPVDVPLKATVVDALEQTGMLSVRVVREGTVTSNVVAPLNW